MAGVTVHLDDSTGGNGARFKADVAEVGSLRYVTLDVYELLYGADRRPSCEVTLFCGAAELAELIRVAGDALAELVAANVAAARADLADLADAG